MPSTSSGKTILTRLHNTLLALSAVHSELHSVDRCLPRSAEVDDSDLKFVLSNHILILVCSFLAEWRRFENLGKEESVRTTLQVAKPFVERIRQWNGLEKIRSALLAHPIRSEKGELVVACELFQKVNAPTNYAEMWLLGICAMRAVEIAVRRHLKEHEEAVSWHEQVSGVLPQRGIVTLRQLGAELKRLEAKSRAIELTLVGQTEN